ncbi:transcriptional regulator [Streptomyces sp. NPDC093248]|uniref:transcriptional regulator n=1 Tax=Streptomyces sp. NPDC093248 TaxID=3155072 RepID=UPI00344A5CE1
MKRIHFTAEDLARTRLATTLGAAAETFDSVRLLRERGLGLAFRPWQASVRGRLDGQAKPLSALMPERGPVIDMVSLAGDAPSIEEAVDNFLGAPRDLMRIELEPIAFHPSHRTWARNLMDGDREARLDVAAALRHVHAVNLAPFARRVRSHLAAMRSACAHTLAEAGVEGLLTDLCTPLLRWRPPVLEVRHSRDADVHLGGRGLVITPTFFSSEQVELLQSPLEPDRAPVLAVPAVTGAAVGAPLWDVGESTDRSLGDLLGRTRAAALAAVADGCGTTELSRRLGISAAAASHHATVLRGAGLITTGREGKAVLHVLTPLGAALLEATGHAG